MSVAALQTALRAAGLLSGGEGGVLDRDTIAAAMRYMIAFDTGKPKPADIAALAVAFTENCHAAQVDTRLRVIHFLAQIAVETGGFTRFVENLNYTTPAVLLRTFPREVVTLDRATDLVAAGAETIANCVYAGRDGNGPPASGDGWRYRGRGPIQVTFRNGYAALGAKLGLDLIGEPDLLLTAVAGIRAALQFWTDRGLNFWADQDNVARVTKLVNGPELRGLGQRTFYRDRLKSIWPA